MALVSTESRTSSISLSMNKEKRAVVTNIILVSQVRLITNISSLICKAFQGKHLFSITIHFYSRRVTDSAITRLQNSPYFCVFKYARAVKQKVWNEAENRERDWGSYAN